MGRKKKSRSASKEIRERVESAFEVIKAEGVSLTAIDALYQYAVYACETDRDEKYAVKVLRKTREMLERYIAESGHDVWELYEYSRKSQYEIEEVGEYFKILLYEAQHKVLDSYMLYIEKDRLAQDRFYLPRRKCLGKLGVIQALQSMLDDELDILSISLPPGVGKTALEMFFHSALCGWFPRDYNLFYSHSGDITKMYYLGVLNIISTEEYRWKDIFPYSNIAYTDAKREQIHINKHMPFANLQTTSVGAKNAGKVRANRFLLCDDIIGGIEEALNINQLDKLWNIYSVDARQRKVPGCKEIHICTRWSVHDIVGRLQRMYENNDRAMFLAKPDIDPVTGKSNFAYDINGFDEDFFHDQELAMDDVSYRCLYKNDPIEREGLLYTEQELRYFTDMPQREPDAILAICDTKDKGSDFLTLLVFNQYGDDYFLSDCLCTDSSDYGVQYGRMAQILVNNRVQECEFESNSGGDRVAFEVDKLVKERGAWCSIVTKPTETNKETRIIVNAAWVKAHVLFKLKDNWGVKTDYSVMMHWLLSYSVSGRNKHDDVPDALANFSLFVSQKYRVKEARISRGPFQRG